MSGTPHFDTYDSGLGREQMLRVGDGQGPRLLIIPPLFDELNRMRRTLLMAMRMANENYNVSAYLPDLPGQNESGTPLVQCRLHDWHNAIQNSIDAVKPITVISLRSGSLLDTDSSNAPMPLYRRWRYAPVQGDRLVTHLIRTQLASDKAAGRRTSQSDYLSPETNTPISLAGYTVSAALLRDLQAATLAPLNDNDLSLDGGLGPALWLRAEPGESSELAANMVANLGLAQ